MLRECRELRTSHYSPYTGDQVDDLGFDTRIGAGAEGRVVGGGGEVDCRARARVSKLNPSVKQHVFLCASQGVETHTAREEAIFRKDSDGVDEEDGNYQSQSVSPSTGCRAAGRFLL